MSFCTEKEQLYVETDASGVSLGVRPLQVRDGVHFPWNKAPNNAVLWPIELASKSLTSAETHYSNIEREASGTPNGLEKSYYYCFSIMSA